jgi:hypothetical protein
VLARENFVSRFHHQRKLCRQHRPQFLRKKRSFLFSFFFKNSGFYYSGCVLSVAISRHEKRGNWRSDLHSKYFKSFHDSWGVESIGWRRASTEVERNDENLLDRLHAWVKMMGSFRSQQQPTNAAVVCADAHSPPNRFPKWDFSEKKNIITLSGPVCSRSTGLWYVFRYISVPYHRHIEKKK